MLSNGNVKERNLKEASYYYNLAAYKGDVFSMNYYANMFSNGEGIRKK